MLERCRRLGMSAPAAHQIIVLAAACWLAAAMLTGVASPAAAAPGSDAHTLLVGLDTVQRITGRDDFVAQPVRDAPVPESNDPHAPAECRAVYGQQDTFGDGWKRFRTTVYSVETGAVATMTNVMQAVAIYPDAKAARTVFDRLGPALESCAELHANFYDFTVNRPDPSTIVLDYRGYQRSVIYQLKSAALINVVAAGFSEPEPVGQAVVAKIADRIK